MGVRSPFTPTLSPLEKGGRGCREWGDVPHTRLIRYGTAIEDSLKASSGSVLPALQAEGRGSDGQEMTGTVDAAARGAI